MKMTSVIVVLICLFMGLLLKRGGIFPDNAPLVLNRYVIYIALPALVLSEIPGVSFGSEALVPVAIAWLVMLISALLTLTTARLFRWSKELTGAMLLVIPLGNTGFVGIPLIEAYVGESGVPYAILYDQLGTFIALNTYGIIVASTYGSAKVNALSIVKSIVTFPAFIALCIAIMLKEFTYPVWFDDAIARISSTLVPVVMFAVGLQWRFKLSSSMISPLIIACFYILFVSPLIALTLLEWVTVDAFVAKVIVMEAAMPAMISAGVLAMEYKLSPEFAASVIGYSLLVGLLSVWVWGQVIGTVV
jgi:predicted permease